MSAFSTICGYIFEDASSHHWNNKGVVMSISLWLDRNRGSSIDEDARLTLAARDDPAAFRPVYEKWLPRVYRYFYFRVGNEKDAEDLASQVFLQAFEAIPRYRDRARFSTWLFTIAHSRMVDYYRRKRAVISLDEVEEMPITDDFSARSDRKEEIQQVLSLLKSLPEDEQELIRLRFVADLSYGEIGDILHRREDSVRKATTRLLQRLQSMMEVNHE
jgi:RNA polymerase sigma-70 factor (ECF subfamily)